MSTSVRSINVSLTWVNKQNRKPEPWTNFRLRIKIADREYPMKVKREEEERVRTAAKMGEWPIKDVKRSI